MNILFVYNNEILPERGGVQRVTSVLADFFESKGYTVLYMHVDNTKATRTNCVPSSRQHYHAHSNNFKKDSASFINFLKDKEISIIINQAGINPYVSKIVNSAKHEKIKIISVINNSILTGIQNFASIHRAWAKKYGLEIILNLTKLSVVNDFLKLLYKLKYQKHYKNLCFNSNRVVILSDSYKDELLFMLGKDINDTLVTIPNPLSFKCETNNLIDVKEKKLLFVGRTDCPYKQVDILLHIWGIVSKEFPDWSLHIIGGEADNKMISISNKLKLDRVIFEPFQDPRPHYATSAIFCLTSSSESFGMVLIEAMQYSVVPIAFKSYNSVSDIIDSPNTGVLIDPFNINEYVNELMSLMKDKDKRELIAKTAKIKSDSFSLESVGKRWLDLIIKPSANNNE